MFYYVKRFRIVELDVKWNEARVREGIMKTIPLVFSLVTSFFNG
jgi:hypothetical protein